MTSAVKNFQWEEKGGCETSPASYYLDTVLRNDILLPGEEELWGAVRIYGLTAL
jgi:hypothetical protein